MAVLRPLSRRPALARPGHREELSRQRYAAKVAYEASIARLADYEALLAAALERHAELAFALGLADQRLTEHDAAQQEKDRAAIVLC